jgi:hypothetical protein
VEETIEEAEAGCDGTIGREDAGETSATTVTCINMQTIYWFVPFSTCSSKERHMDLHNKYYLFTQSSRAVIVGVWQLMCMLLFAHVSHTHTNTTHSQSTVTALARLRGLSGL